MANRVGQQLGNYRLVRLLGDGAFAEVYLGEHALLGTQAAIKVLNALLTSQEAQKFQDEARMIARLKHPNIVRVLEFGMQGKIPYLVMDYAPNGTLHDRHVSGTPVPLNTVVGYIKQVADALQYAHNAKLIHRDVKPENLLVGERNEILLSDFGIAVAAHSTRTQVIQDKIGTLPYMAPEQIDGYPVPASDQYALGIIVYQWLTGELPFQGTDVEIITKHRHAPPPPLRAKVPSIPPMVEQAVLMALQKDPKKRFASIQAFAYALEQAYLQAIAPTLPVVTPTPQVISPTLPVGQFTPPNPAAPVAKMYPPMPTRRPGTLICKRDGNFQFMVWSPDGKYIASTANQYIYIWDAASGKDVYNYNHSNIVRRVTWAPDGKWLASSSIDKTIQIRASKTGKLEFTYTGHFGAVKDVSWAPDSRLIVSASDDNSVHIWDMLTGYAISTYRDTLAAAWSPDGAFLAIAGTTGIQILDRGSLHQVAHVAFNEQISGVLNLKWSPNSRFLASYQLSGRANINLVQIWDTRSGRLLFNCDGSSMIWSPDGAFLATWTKGSERQSGTEIPRTRPARRISRSPLPQQVVQQQTVLGTSQQPHDVVQIWDVAAKKNVYIYTGHRQQISTVAWSPNGARIASASRDGTVQVWNATSGNYVFIYREHGGAVLNALYSPDGTSIASLGRGNSNVSISINIWAAS